MENNNYLTIGEDSSVTASDNNIDSFIDSTCSSTSIVICGDTDVEEDLHNNLNGLQGGNIYERYHLTRAEWLNLTTGDSAPVNLIAGPHITIDANYPNFTISGEAGFSGDYDDLINKPTLFDGTWNSLTGKPTLLSQFTNNLGNYGNWITKAQGDTFYRNITYVPDWTEITNKPTFFSGNYNDLTNKPTIPNSTNYIQNQNTVTQQASLRINGTGVFGDFVAANQMLANIVSSINGASNGALAFGTANEGTILTREIADEKPALTVNNRLGTSRIVTFQQGGINVAGVLPDGRLDAGGMQAFGNGSLASILTNSSGTTITRNMNDATTALTVNNIIGTGSIVDFQYGSSSKFKILRSGIFNINNTVGTGGQAIRINSGNTAMEYYTPIAQFNPIAGSNVTITGTYPNITFNATAGASVPTLQAVTQVGAVTDHGLRVTGFTGIDNSVGLNIYHIPDMGSLLTNSLSDNTTSSGIILRDNKSVNIQAGTGGITFNEASSNGGLGGTIIGRLAGESGVNPKDFVTMDQLGSGATPNLQNVTDSGNTTNKMISAASMRAGVVGNDSYGFTFQTGDAFTIQQEEQSDPNLRTSRFGHSGISFSYKGFQQGISVNYPGITNNSLLQFPLNKSGIIALISDIPSALIIDNNPTNGSTNAVSSNGTYNALLTKEVLTNKVNTLIDVTTPVSMYPTVSAVNTGLGLKANVKTANIFEATQAIRGALQVTGISSNQTTLIEMTAANNGSGVRGSIALAAYNTDGLGVTYTSTLVPGTTADGNGAINILPVSSGTLLNSTNVKTINGTSIFGSGNITIASGSGTVTSVTLNPTDGLTGSVDTGTTTPVINISGINLAPATGSANYIQNQTTVIQNAAIRINGIIQGGSITGTTLNLTSGSASAVSLPTLLGRNSGGGVGTRTLAQVLADLDTTAGVTTYVQNQTTTPQPGVSFSIAGQGLIATAPTLANHIVRLTDLGNYITTNTTQTVTGLKTFSFRQTFNSGWTTVNSSNTVQNGGIFFSDGTFGVNLSTNLGTMTVNGTVRLPINVTGLLALTAQATDYEVTDTTKGYILKSPNGTRWRITISDTGVLSTTSL